VIVAVVLVRVVKVASNGIVDVIAVPDGLVTAARAMPVFGLVLGAIVVWRAVGGVGV